MESTQRPAGFRFYLDAALAFLVIVMWGFSYVIIRVTVKDGIIPPFTLAFIRFIIAYVVLLAIPLRKGTLRPGWRDSLNIFSMGFFGVFLYFSLENAALIFTTATNASILITLAPVFTTIGALLFFKRRVLPVNWLGMLIAFCGGAFVVWNGQVHLELNPIGDLLVILSATAWAGYTLVGERIVKTYSPLLISRRIIASGLLLLAPFSAWEVLSGQASNITPLSLLGVVYLGVFCSAVAFLLWNKLMASLGIIFVTNMIYLQAAVTMLCAWATIHEPITLMLLIGSATVLAGVYLANIEKHVELPKQAPGVPRFRNTLRKNP